MFSFLESNGTPFPETEICAIEKNFNIKFPDLIRKYYLYHNNADIAETSLDIGGETYQVVCLLDILTVKMILQENIKYGISNNFIPFANDWFDNLLCWNKNDNKIYLMYTDSDVPKLVMKNMEEFITKMRIDSHS